MNAPSTSNGADQRGCLWKAALGCFGLAALVVLASIGGIYWVWNKVALDEGQAEEAAGRILPLTWPPGLTPSGGLKLGERTVVWAGDGELDHPDTFFIVLLLLPAGGDSAAGDWREELDLRVQDEQAVESRTVELKVHGLPRPAVWSRFDSGRVSCELSVEHAGRTVLLLFSGPPDKLDLPVVQATLDSLG